MLAARQIFVMGLAIDFVVKSSIRDALDSINSIGLPNVTVALVLEGSMGIFEQGVQVRP